MYTHPSSHMTFIQIISPSPPHIQFQPQLLSSRIHPQLRSYIYTNTHQCIVYTHCPFSLAIPIGTMQRICNASQMMQDPSLLYMLHSFLFSNSQLKGGTRLPLGSQSSRALLSSAAAGGERLLSHSFMKSEAVFFRLLGVRRLRTGGRSSSSLFVVDEVDGVEDRGEGEWFLRRPVE